MEGKGDRFMIGSHILSWVEEWKSKVWQPTEETLQKVRDKWVLMGSMEYQAAYTIWSKYKREKELTNKHLQELVQHSLFLSDERKAKGKTPNKDFLTQEIGKYLKTLI
jgi:hypothetical protein